MEIISGSLSDSSLRLDDLSAWHVLRPLLDDGPYLPWSSGALRPAALVVVCNEIVLRGRTRVVECGSGASTVLLARLLKQLRTGGALVALEHNEQWVDLVTGLLHREKLDDIARVIHAPLEGDPPWYSRAVIPLTPERIDLLIVDGPPAYEAGHERRREPALAQFDSRLAADATVVLDDIDRSGERDVLAAWQRQLAWDFEVNEPAGVAVGARRGYAS